LKFLKDIDIPQTGNSSRNNETRDQKSNTQSEKSKSSNNTNNQPENLTLAEYAESTYPLGALTSVSQIKSQSAEKNPLRNQFKRLLNPTAIKVITTIPMMTMVGEILE